MSALKPPFKGRFLNFAPEAVRDAYERSGTIAGAASLLGIGYWRTRIMLGAMGLGKRRPEYVGRFRDSISREAVLDAYREAGSVSDAAKVLMIGRHLMSKLLDREGVPRRKRWTRRDKK